MPLALWVTRPEDLSGLPNSTSVSTSTSGIDWPPLSLRHSSPQVKSLPSPQSSMWLRAIRIPRSGRRQTLIYIWSLLARWGPFPVPFTPRVLFVTAIWGFMAMQKTAEGGREVLVRGRSPSFLFRHISLPAAEQSQSVLPFQFNASNFGAAVEHKHTLSLLDTLEQKGTRLLLPQRKSIAYTLYK